ncbi:hypothetical protein PR048_006768 [Dryococelus australis]|uniref:Uncharacterized protein n=1 Tax=Dryococelus australis TaxID=614101 RepID=A0ABQ9IE31_9NEOP|nr:hypothetical protein PR048_006768 [Dryococelus australis]
MVGTILKAAMDTAEVTRPIRNGLHHPRSLVFDPVKLLSPPMITEAPDMLAELLRGEINGIVRNRRVIAAERWSKHAKSSKLRSLGPGQLVLVSATNT